MTAADLPTTHGIPNNGGEGFRFLGYPAYDSVVNWDFTHTDKLADITPGLFTAWRIDEANPLRWICDVRQGVKFHDGSDFNADAVIFNFGRIFDEKSPQYDAPAAPIVRATVSMIDTYEKADDKNDRHHDEISVQLPALPADPHPDRQPGAMGGTARTGPSFAKNPAGTGPFKITKVVLGQYAEMSRNEAYWDTARIPKLDKMVVYPMPEATTRVAALRSGQVDWIEVPPPDAIPSLKAAGLQISLWPYPHTYPYALNCTDSSPFKDERVRQAINYAIDREGMCAMLNGTAKPAVGLYPPERPAVRHAGEPLQIRSGKGQGAAEGSRLRSGQAGEGEDHDLDLGVRADGADPDERVHAAEFQGRRHGHRFRRGRMGHHAGRRPQRSEIAAVARRRRDQYQPELHRSVLDVPLLRQGQFFARQLQLGALGQSAGDRPAEKGPGDVRSRTSRTELLAQAHAMVVDGAPWLFIVHDLNPRAMSKKVTGFKPAQSWYQDFTQISMA